MFLKTFWPLIFVAIFAPFVALSWIDSVFRSYQLEVFRNPALGESDFRYMAAGILAATENLSLHEAFVKAGSLKLSEIKELLKKDFPIRCYEIPIEELQRRGMFQSKALPNLAVNRQVFNHDGKTWVRWFVHPLHSNDFIDSHFSVYKVKNRFRAMLTASRSLIIKDTESMEQWSLKSALNLAQGPFKGKNYNPIQAAYHFEMSSIIVNDSFLRERFFTEESFIAFETSDFKEGQIVRSLAPFKSDEWIYALSTMFSSQIAKNIASLNGYGANWQQFLVDVVMPDLGEVMGYLYGRYGLVHNSLHSQNVMVRFDKKNGLYRGILLKDPDFDVDIDRFRKSMGDRAADNFLARSNIRTIDTLIVDLSVLNGLKYFPIFGEERHFFYRAMGVKFYTAFLEQLAKVRGASISIEEIKKRAEEYVHITSLDEHGLRQASTCNGSALELLIDPNAELPAPKVVPQKIPLTNIQEAIGLQRTAVLFGGVNLLNYETVDVSRAWQSIVSNLRENPNESWLNFVLQENDPATVHSLVVALNSQGGSTPSALMNYIIEKYPNVLHTNDVAFYFNRHFDPDLLHRFLARASEKNLISLWAFRNENQLLQYPPYVLRRYLFRMGLKRVINIKTQIETNRTQPLAFHDKTLEAWYEPVMDAIHVRNYLSKGQSCHALFVISGK